jgi:capsular exopolysaccharide synthesis family protein
MTDYEKQIEHIVDSLGCSIAEAKQIIEDDSKIDKGQEVNFGLSKEEEKRALKLANVREHKKPMVLNLTKSLAELGKRVLVIDADMRKSVMAGRHTKAKNPSGLSEILTGIVKLSDGLYSTQYDNLHIIFSGKYPPNPVELLGGKYFPELISETRKVFDYILIDTPPLGRVIDAAVVAPQCDGVILVLANNAVRSSKAREVVGQLRKSGSKILGVVRNCVAAPSVGYYKK